MTILYNFIYSIYSDLHILPDALFKKIDDYEIKINILEEIFNNNQKLIREQVINKYSNFKFNFNDQYVLLRRILPREKEYVEKYSGLKNILAHIYIAAVLHNSLLLTHLANLF